MASVGAMPIKCHEPTVMALARSGIDPAPMYYRLRYLAHWKEPSRSCSTGHTNESSKGFSSKANALCLVLHATYPTPQRTFVVTYVILILLVHRQAQFTPILLPPPTPRRSLTPRAHISLASCGRYLPASRPPIAPWVGRAELAADQPSPRVLLTNASMLSTPPFHPPSSLICSPPLLASARALLASIYDDAPTATPLAASLLLSTLFAG
ncbi:hypothetical protein B0H13DRAFT_2672483 [Mycena leptocephala]|nr:hypothetical protein B0H13DRAFT_2672483 [Mycena leptocephala]